MVSHMSRSIIYVTHTTVIITLSILVHTPSPLTSAPMHAHSRSKCTHLHEIEENIGASKLRGGGLHDIKQTKALTLHDHRYAMYLQW